MNALLRYMRPLGFKGSGVFAYNYHAHFYRELSEFQTIIVVSNLFPKNISAFRLRRHQWKLWKANKLSIVPPGCVSATGVAHINKRKMLFVGEFKSHLHIHELIQKYLVSITS